MSLSHPYLTLISPLSHPDVVAALALALAWGLVWALFLQLTRTGRFLVQQRTWLTVVIGVGVDLLILALIMPWDWWLRVAAVFAVSSLPIIARSLTNEHREEQERMDEAKESAT